MNQAYALFFGHYHCFAIGSISVSSEPSKSVLDLHKGKSGSYRYDVKVTHPFCGATQGRRNQIRRTGSPFEPSKANVAPTCSLSFRYPKQNVST